MVHSALKGWFHSFFLQLEHHILQQILIFTVVPRNLMVGEMKKSFLRICIDWWWWSMVAKLSKRRFSIKAITEDWWRWLQIKKNPLDWEEKSICRLFTWTPKTHGINGQYGCTKTYCLDEIDDVDCREGWWRVCSIGGLQSRRRCNNWAPTNSALHLVKHCTALNNPI